MYDFLSFKILRVLKRLLFFWFFNFKYGFGYGLSLFQFFSSQIYKDILGFILYKTETVFFF